MPPQASLTKDEVLYADAILKAPDVATRPFIATSRCGGLDLAGILAGRCCRLGKYQRGPLRVL